MTICGMGMDISVTNTFFITLVVFFIRASSYEPSNPARLVGQILSSVHMGMFSPVNKRWAVQHKDNGNKFGFYGLL